MRFVPLIKLTLIEMQCVCELLMECFILVSGKIWAAGALRNPHTALVLRHNRIYDYFLPSHSAREVFDVKQARVIAANSITRKFNE